MADGVDRIDAGGKYRRRVGAGTTLRTAITDQRSEQMFYRITNGVRITVRPRYAEDHSDPSEPRHVFVYHIRIENVGDRTAQLMWRHWDIHDDALPDDTEVEGEGVVGEQPVIAPGQVHEYESFCVLRGTRGWMQGWYEFVRPDGSKFRAEVPRFELLAGAAGHGSGPPLNQRPD